MKKPLNIKKCKECVNTEEYLCGVDHMDECIVKLIAEIEQLREEKNQMIVRIKKEVISRVMWNSLNMIQDLRVLWGRGKNKDV